MCKLLISSFEISDVAKLITEPAMVGKKRKWGKFYERRILREQDLKTDRGNA